MAILGDKISTQFIRTFGLPKWLETRGLEGWLEIATEDLELSAKQRIAKEIESHYAEAVSAHIVAGELELSARGQALAELGDPRDAARDFCKTYLTSSDVKWLRSMEKMAAQRFFSFQTVPLVSIDLLPLAGLALFVNPPHSSPSWRIVALFLLSIFGGFRLIPRLLFLRMLPRKTFVKGIALSGLAGSITVLLAYALSIFLKHRPEFCVTLCFYLNGFLFRRAHEVWRKLRKTTTEHSDGVLPDTIPSP
jgi:hypothetical protein